MPEPCILNPSINRFVCKPRPEPSETTALHAFLLQERQTIEAMYDWFGDSITHEEAATYTRLVADLQERILLLENVILAGAQGSFSCGIY